MLHSFCHLHNGWEEGPIGELRAGQSYVTVTLMPVNATAALPADPGTVSYLGKGIYDICEVARLLCRGRAMVEGWTRARAGALPLLTGELGGLFSFWDLVSLRVVAELRRRGVPRDHIARGAKHLEMTLETDRPFAHEALATVGTGFFADVAGEWEDAGQGGQLAFQATVEPLLKPITFNDDKMASIWRPHERVWINPEVQAGTPCVDGTRVPTRLLASLLNPEQPDESAFKAVCDDYRLTERQVRSALDYEVAIAA